MDTKLTREELDQWLQELSVRVKPEAETALAGDIAEIVAGEVEVIEPRLASADFEYFHDQVSDIIDNLVRVNASTPDETTDL
jgi:phosphoenolpyruvate synthase/pyruvate phosphate dikinase